MINIISEILQKAKDKLKKNGIKSVADADFLLAFVLQVSKSQLVTITQVSSQQIKEFDSLIERRIKREPMDSILGFTEYLGLKFPFNKSTLTPRQETEIMVDRIIREYSGRQNLKVLDLCSGSGCIGLSIAKYLNASVVLSDISKEALEISQQNALLNNIKASFILSDLFDNIVGKFDIIISNPPYIPSQDINDLEIEVKDYDPILALNGGEDGLDFYRRIIKESPKYLNDNGIIFLEFGINQAKDIYELMLENFEDIQIFKDYSGIERYIKARKK